MRYIERNHRRSDRYQSLLLGLHRRGAELSSKFSTQDFDGVLSQLREMEV